MPITRPRPDEVCVFPSAAGLRSWLEENHETARELWVGYYKKGVPKTAATYAQAVEEALCFGWIDGITYRIDDQVTASRFTPRRKGSNWSATNIARVAELRAAGRMHPAGLRAFEQRDRSKESQYSYERPPDELPAAAVQRIKANRAAWDYWQAQRPSYRQTVVSWIQSAKRPETRERRLASLIADSAAGRPVKPMSYGTGRR